MKVGRVNGAQSCKVRCLRAPPGSEVFAGSIGVLTSFMFLLECPAFVFTAELTDVVGEKFVAQADIVNAAGWKFEYRESEE